MVPILTAEMSNTKSTKLCMLFVFVSIMFSTEQRFFSIVRDAVSVLKSRPKNLVQLGVLHSISGISGAIGHRDILRSYPHERIID